MNRFPKSARVLGQLALACLQLTAVLGSPSAVEAQVQHDPVGTGRLFGWSQVSRWTPAGVDTLVAPVADTSIVVLVPAPGEVADPAREVFLYDGELVGGMRLKVEAQRQPSLLDFAVADERVAFERRLGGMLYEVVARLLPLRLRGDSFTDTLTIRHVSARQVLITADTIAPDTTEFTRQRVGRVEGHVTIGGRSWLRIHARGTDRFKAQRVVESNFEPTRLYLQLAGSVEETFLYDPRSGETDSVRQVLKWTGSLRYVSPDGSTHWQRGRWDAQRTGAWGPDTRADVDANMRLAWRDGRHVGDPSDTLSPVSRFVRAAYRGDKAAIDSLLERRGRAGAYVERRVIEAALDRAVAGADLYGVLIQRLLSRYRPGDHFAITRFLNAQQATQRAVDSAAARVLTAALGTRARQRVHVLDRQEAFAHLLPALGGADSVTAAAAELLAAAANRTDDPRVGELFMLGAYRGQPRRFLAAVERFSDSTAGYGPIVRRYAQGDPSHLNWSWGMNAAELAAFPATPLPPLTAPASQHAAHATRMGGYWQPQQLREWLLGHEPDGEAAIRRRFETDSTNKEQLIWAQYLLQLGDHRVVPWIKALSQSSDSAEQRGANRVMDSYRWKSLFADTVRDEALLVELQDMLLAYATDATTLTMESGERFESFRPHNERPDQRLLLLDNVALGIRQGSRWSGVFAFISADSLRALAEREGLAMAHWMSPVLQIGDRYEATIGLAPFARPGDMCLCGGAVTFTLVRRNGGWVILSAFQVVS